MVAWRSALQKLDGAFSDHTLFEAPVPYQSRVKPVIVVRGREQQHALARAAHAIDLGQHQVDKRTPPLQVAGLEVGAGGE